MSEQHGPEAGPHDLAAPYALDAVSDREREEFEVHLSRCPSCQDEVRDLREAAVALSEGMERTPPDHLRSRVLDQVAEAGRPEDSPVTLPEGVARFPRVGSDAADTPASAPAAGPVRSRRGWWLAAAAAIVIGTGGYVASQVLPEQDPAARIVQAQDAREFEAATGEATVIASADQRAAVLRLTGDLGPAPQGQVYQAWYVGEDGSARSAGLLTADVVGDGEVVLQGDPEGAAAVGLTLEPEGGSEQPTSEPFTVVPLG